MSRSFGIDTSPRTKYVVYNYGADGVACERCEVECDTLAEAIDEAACRVGAHTELEPWRKWDGFEAEDSDLISVMGLHDNQKSGCGGVQISKTEL